MLKYILLLATFSSIALSADDICIAKINRDRMMWPNLAFGNEAFYDVACTNGEKFKTQEKYNFSTSTTRSRKVLMELMNSKGYERVAVPSAGNTLILFSTHEVDFNYLCEVVPREEETNLDGEQLYSVYIDCMSLTTKQRDRGTHSVRLQADEVEEYLTRLEFEKMIANEDFAGGYYTK